MRHCYSWVKLALVTVALTVACHSHGQGGGAGQSTDEESVVVEPAKEGDVQVASLLGAKETSDMHDDTTLLRTVTALEDDTGLMLFDALRIWVGGAVQYDYSVIDGVYNHSNDGERHEEGNMRRLEGILRAQLYDWGEIKAQYDLDAGIFRDLYLRWVSRALTRH